MRAVRYIGSRIVATFRAVPAFLVHGVPDTARMWEPLRAHLGRTDVIAPSLPGFGTPAPPGFDATKESYAAWLIGELERVGEPADLVGHDWGSILVQHVVSVRPDLVRTWACGSGPVDREYVWHDMAQLWQTPGAGEEIMTGMTGPALATFLEAEIGPEQAEIVAAQLDETMKHCILRLYRSAVHAGAEWADAVDRIARPGLVLWGADDAYVAAEFAERLGRRTGARVVVWEDTGHWWPITKAREAARELQRHWASA